MARSGSSDSRSADHRAAGPGRHPPAERPATSDADFWAVFECAPDAYLLLAPDPPHFTMVAANDARLRVTMTRREDVIGRPLFEVFPDNPTDPGATGVRNLQASLDEVLRTGKPHRMALQKYDIRAPDGEFEERYWEPLNSPVFDTDGKLIYLIHRVEDVTEQVRSGSRLRVLESVVTTANEAVVITEPGPLEDPGPRIIYVNEAFTRMTGYEATEVIGNTPRILQGPHTDSAARGRIRNALARREPIQVELLNYRKDGRPFWVEMSIAPVRDADGRLTHWTSVQRDTTQRRQAEEGRRRLMEVTAAREQVEALLNHLPDMAWMKDPESRYLAMNEATARAIGLSSRGDAVGRTDFDFYPEEIAERFRELDRRVLVEGDKISVEESIPGPDGGWIRVETIRTPIHDHSGQIVGTVGIARDITERKRTEEALRESEERYRLLAEMIPQHIWTSDPNGHNRYYSRSWYDFTGMTPEQSLGNGWVAALHPEDRARTLERWQHSLRTGEPLSIEYRFRKAIGEYCWFLGKAVPQRNAAGEIVLWFGTLTDITDRKRLEEERERLLEREREVREQVTTILESVTDAFFAVDREWRFTHVNHEGERLLKRSREELLGRSLWQEFPDAVGSTFQQEYGRAMTEQETVHFEAFAPSLRIWVDARAYPSDGGLSVFFRDVSSRKVAEEKLRESEGRFRALAENATMAIFVIDEESTIEFANPAVERIFGYTMPEMLGQSIDMLMPEDQRPLHDGGMRRYLETGRRNIRWEGVELPGLTKDGRVVPLEISMGEFVRDGRHYFTGIARDISERKQAEEALRESEQRFRAVANSIPQLAWMADATGWIFWYNERWHEYTGTTLDEMEGWGWQKVHHPEHVDRVVNNIRHAFETGTRWEDTFPLRSRTGEYRWFLSRALPIKDRDGQVVRWFGTNTDVTEQIEAVAERERLLATAEEARAEAERRREELERVTESRTRLMRGFTHDVKNPLGAADGFAQLLEDGILGELSEKQRDSVRRIRRTIQTSLHLLHELLELARAESGQIELESVRTNAAELAQETAEDFRAQATAAGLGLEVRAGEPLPTETDPARVRQILNNLLSNAVKYTPEGRITVEAGLQGGGNGSHGGDWISIRVSDTGPGIPAEKRETIFQEFTRLDPEAKHGAGVGLAISRRIARLLGGDITVESEVGRGSTFTLKLPPTAPE